MEASLLHSEMRFGPLSDGDRAEDREERYT